MSKGTSRSLNVGWIVIICLMTALPALAQDDAGGGDDAGVTSWAKAFLTSDDPVGLGIIWLLLLMSALSIGYSLKLFMIAAIVRGSLKVESTEPLPKVDTTTAPPTEELEVE